MISVSVLVPTKGRPEMLREALGSLANQTMPLKHFEVLVLNDGGLPIRPNGFPGGLAGKVFNLPHRGQSATLNEGLDLARGIYVTVAQDDDLVLPEKLRVLAEALDHASMDVGAVYSLPQYTDSTGSPITTPRVLREYLRAHPFVTWDTIQTEYAGLTMHGTGTMYRTRVLRDCGGWDADLPTAEEFDLHLRLLKAGWVFQAVDAVTVTYRQHDGGKSQHVSRRRGLVRKQAMERIYAKVGFVPQAEPMEVR